MEKVIIVVDAGGTKTKVCIINAYKEIVFTDVEGCGSPAVTPEKEAMSNIYNGIKKATDYCIDKYEVCAIVVGMSGFDIIDKNYYTNKFATDFKTKVILDNDVVLAAYATFTDLYDEGVLVLSGTGSAVLGLKNNQTRLFGGWGHLLTEVGSSFMVVRNFIYNAIRRYDSEGTITDLTKRFMAHLNYTRLEQFKIFIYQNTKDKIAAYSRFFTEAAEIEGNEEAIAALKKSGYDLAVDVRNAYNRLNLSSNTVLGFMGGFINNSKILQNEVINNLKEFGINTHVVHGDSDPVYGAYYMVKRMGMLC